jgi:hypothetical protein
LRWTQWLKPIILATQKVEIRRIVVQAQPRQKFKRPHLNKWVCMVVHMWGSTSRRIAMQAAPDIKQDPISK